MLRVVSVALTLSLVGFCAAPTRGQTGSSSFPDALNHALQHAGGGQLLLGRSEGNGVFGFYFLMPNGQIREFEIRGNGKVVKDKVVSGNFSADLLAALKVRKGAKIPFTRFMELASGEVKNGSLSRIEVTLSEGSIRVQIDVVTGNETRRVEIDVETGRVTGVSSV